VRFEKGCALCQEIRASHFFNFYKPGLTGYRYLCENKITRLPFSSMQPLNRHSSRSDIKNFNKHHIQTMVQENRYVVYTPNPVRKNQTLHDIFFPPPPPPTNLNDDPTHYFFWYLFIEPGFGQSMIVTDF